MTKHLDFTSFRAIWRITGFDAKIWMPLNVSHNTCVLNPDEYVSRTRISISFLCRSHTKTHPQRHTFDDVVSLRCCVGVTPTIETNCYLKASINPILLAPISPENTRDSSRMVMTMATATTTTVQLQLRSHWVKKWQKKPLFPRYLITSYTRNRIFSVCCHVTHTFFDAEFFVDRQNKAILIVTTRNLHNFWFSLLKLNFTLRERRQSQKNTFRRRSIVIWISLPSSSHKMIIIIKLCRQSTYCCSHSLSMFPGKFCCCLLCNTCHKVLFNCQKHA